MHYADRRNTPRNACYLTAATVNLQYVFIVAYNFRSPLPRGTLVHNYVRQMLSRCWNYRSHRGRD